MLDGEVVQEQEQEQEKAKDKDDEKQRQAQIHMMAQLDLDRGNTNPWCVPHTRNKRTHRAPCLCTSTRATTLCELRRSPIGCGVMWW